MNTGGGKTVVGLLVAQSSLAEGAGPAVYLVPDHYLADQVMAEARRLGIAVTDNARDMDYARGRAILVDVFQRLFNGQSVFGVDGSADRAAVVPAPGTIVIDDAHACLGKAEHAFRLTVPGDEPAYDALLALFRDAIEQQSPASYLDLADGRARAIQVVPYWAWIDQQRTVLETLHPLSGEVPYIFAWPLLADILPDCRAVFTADGLEIAAPCVNSDVLPGFRQASRRVYLTATLADDGVLVADFGADADQVAKPIVPANADDIGDRLILVPQQTHPAASEDEIREVILGLARARNVAVIVPSNARAAYWADDDATMVLDKDNLAAEDVEGLIAGTGIGTLRQAAQQCLDRDPDWLAASRGRLATLRYGDAVVTTFARSSRAAFEHATAKDYRAARRRAAEGGQRH